MSSLSIYLHQQNTQSSSQITVQEQCSHKTEMLRCEGSTGVCFTLQMYNGVTLKVGMAQVTVPVHQRHLSIRVAVQDEEPMNTRAKHNTRCVNAASGEHKNTDNVAIFQLETIPVWSVGIRLGFCYCSQYRDSKTVPHHQHSVGQHKKMYRSSL